MQYLGQKYKIGHVSLEEHPDSLLYWKKVDIYLKGVEKNINTYEIENPNELNKVIEENDIIVIDSYPKLQELDKKIEIDTHFRKKYNGKLFLIVFQLTSSGKMRGGSKSQFDGDCILRIKKHLKYQDNYVYATKNRYQTKPLSELKYNIYTGSLINDDDIKNIA